MSTFNILLDKRVKLKHDTYNVMIRIIDGRKIIYIKTGHKILEEEYNHIFVENSTDPSHILIRDNCKNVLDKVTDYYPTQENWNMTEFRELVKTIKPKKYISLDRLIYAHEYSDLRVYIGLTGKPLKRKSAHKFMGTVYEYTKLSGLIPDYIELTGYMDEKQTSIEEEVWKKIYEANGWIVLNRAPTGGLGGSYQKWNIITVRIEASKYNTRKEFEENAPGAYEAARSGRYLPDVCGHMKKPYHDTWTFEEVFEVALYYKTRNEFCIGNNGAYTAARLNGWLDKVCSHMKPVYHEWSVIEIIDIALKHKTNGDLKKYDRNTYSSAVRKNMLNILNELRTINNKSNGQEQTNDR